VKTNRGAIPARRPAPTSSKVLLHSFSGQPVFHVTAAGAAGITSGTTTSGGSSVTPASGALGAGTTVGATGVSVTTNATAPATGVGPASVSQFAVINGFAIGGALLPGAAGIFLDNDGYTAVTNNVLGGADVTNPAYTGAPCAAGTTKPLPPGQGFTPPAPVAKVEPFGNAAGVLLQNSDHPNIVNNDIRGSGRFAFAPVLGPAVLGGFGVVTTECLGLGPDVSDGVTLANNLVEGNANAGVWLCSDGGGLHSISTNVLRNNGRGVLLRAISNSTVASNTISNDTQDGIVLYDVASNNTLSNNTVESHRTPGSAGIRVGGFGAVYYPLATTVTGNRLLRNWVGVTLSGAQNTLVQSNTITAEALRTAVLVQVGSATGAALTQPSGTVLRQNALVSNGGCTASAGCAIRLDGGVTVDVDATQQTSYGIPPTTDVNVVLWHKPNDPSLGFISTGQQPPALSVASAGGPAQCVTVNNPPGCVGAPSGGSTATGALSGPSSGATCTSVGNPAGCVAPTAATAQCNDGTYSYTATRSGACSGHGGVAQYLGPLASGDSVSAPVGGGTTGGTPSSTSGGSTGGSLPACTLPNQASCIPQTCVSANTPPGCVEPPATQ
jgi:parallel beta-helix repeat protein